MPVAMATEAGASAEGRATGFFCSTSGTYFTDKESLAEHYRSDFHKYNLKRKVAGLPPVTKEWFDARKAQLASAAAAPTQRVWYDPLTGKKFMSEAKYREHVSSKKYAELVRRSGEAAPAPVVMLKRLGEAAAVAPGAAAAAPTAAAAATASPGAAAAGKRTPGFKVKAPHRPSPTVDAAGNAIDEASSEEEEEENEDEVEEEGGWETASEDEEAAVAGEDGLVAAAAGLSLGAHGRTTLRARRRAAAPAADAAADAASSADEEAGSADDDGGDDDDDEGWEEWDLRRSLFDNRVAPSMQDNLEYMFKRFGFYLPDAEYLVDPEGLIRYLGSKLRYGKVPLYTAGDDPNARQFRSLHAVQRHMVDANRCKMVYDDNEDEYADFYDYSPQHAGGAAAEGEGAEPAAAAGAGAGGALVAGGGGDSSERFMTNGMEMVVGGGEGGARGKVLGSRWLARYYKQRHRPGATGAAAVAAAGRALLSPAAGQVVAHYRALGIETRDPSVNADAKRAQKAVRRMERHRLNLAMRTNVNNNLPSNVPY